MSQGWSNIIKRLQHETALSKAWVRNDQILFVNNVNSEQQKIKVHRSRPLMNSPDPIEGFCLDLQKKSQQGTGVKSASQSKHSIKKYILVYISNR